MLKAKSKSVLHEKKPANSSSRNQGNNDRLSLDDESDRLVMVLFPKETWDKVQEMASNVKMSSAEILSIAIEELNEKIENAKTTSDI